MVTVNTRVSGGQEGFIEEALFDENTGEEKLEDLCHEQAGQLLKKIGEELVGVRDIICYLDVVFLLPADPKGRSRGFAFSPLRVGIDNYFKFVMELVSNNFDVAGHPVFRHGLPQIKAANGSTHVPATEDELKLLLDETRITSISGRILTIGLCDGETEEPGTEICEAPTGVGHGPPSEYHSVYWNIERGSGSGKYGGPFQSVLQNFDEYGRRLAPLRTCITNFRGEAMTHVTAVPICWWIKGREGNLIPSQGGSFIVGTSRSLDEAELKELIGIVASRISAGYLARAAESGGQKQQQMTFAHHTSAVIDSIIALIEDLPEAVREGMGGLLMAEIHLLRATINSYRKKAARVNPGDFPYRWDDRSPLEVYRDIGIQLGFARAREAPEEERDVRRAGMSALRAENRPGEKGFEEYKQMLFGKLPEVDEEVRDHLKHSSFAVLILITLKQAVYHTIRARCRGLAEACVKLNVRSRADDLIFECTVLNPSVSEEEKSRESKEVAQLKDLADRLSNLSTLKDHDDPPSPIREHKERYSVEGPIYDRQTNCWLTTTRIHSKS